MDFLYYMAYNNNSINRSGATSVALKRKRLLKKFKSDTGQPRKDLIIYQYLVFGLKKLKENGIPTQDLEDLLSREE